MPEYGFTPQDISSMSQARQGLVEGFMQLGKQIQQDITRIATIREMKAFGQEMANLDPTSDAFPQQLIGTLSKYPLASNTQLASKGIEVLGTRYRAAQQAKQRTGFSEEVHLGGNLYSRRGVGTYEKDPSTGEVKFVDTTPNEPAPESGLLVNTPKGQQLVGRRTGSVIAEFGQKPPTGGFQTQNLAMQVRGIDSDIRAVTQERQKMIDSIGDITGLKTDDPKLQRVKQLEGQLQQLKDVRGQLLQGSGSPSMPTGAGQNVGGPSLMPIGTGAPSSNFVTMPSPNGTAAPGTIPAPANMKLNEPGANVMPDQMPVLPDPTTLKEAQAKTRRLYRIEGGKFKPSSRDPGVVKQAVEQALADRAISDADRAFIFQQAGLQ